MSAFFGMNFTRMGAIREINAIYNVEYPMTMVFIIGIFSGNIIEN